MKKIWIGCSVIAIAIGLSFFFWKKIKEGFFTDIAKLDYVQCQDVIVNNRIVKKASPNHDSESRYKVIQKVLDQYKRPFTMLDLGARQGYFSFRTAHDYESVCVMIEGNHLHYPRAGTQLLGLCKANDQLENIVFLNKPIAVEDLRRMSECEAFDVVLAFNVIHSFGMETWEDLADTILGLGDITIIETPPQDPDLGEETNAFRKKIENYLLSKNGKVIGQVPSFSSPAIMSNIYVIEAEKKHISRKTWIRKPGEALAYEIHSNYKEKFIKKVYASQQEEVSTWIPGINLITFKMYNGAYPTKEKLKASIEKLAKEPHSDWRAGNMVVQGSSLSLIDKTDPYRPQTSTCNERKLQRHLRFIEIDDPQEIESFFWKKIGDKILRIE